MSKLLDLNITTKFRLDDQDDDDDDLSPSNIKSADSSSVLHSSRHDLLPLHTRRSSFNHADVASLHSPLLKICKSHDAIYDRFHPILTRSRLSLHSYSARSHTFHELNRKPSLVLRDIPSPPVPLDQAGINHVHQILKQLLAQLNVPNEIDWENLLSPIIFKCVDSVCPDVQRNDEIDIRYYIKLKKILSQRGIDASHVSGVVFSKNTALKSMHRKLTNPRIALITFPIEYAQSQSHLLSLDAVIAEEVDYLQSLVSRIASLNVDLLFAQKNVAGLAMKYLNEAKIVVIHHVKPSVINAISRCTQARIISSADALLPGIIGLGACENFDVKTYVFNGIKKTYIYLTGCPPKLGCSIVIRGPDMEILRKIKCMTEFMCYVVYNLKLETSLLENELVTYTPDERDMTSANVISFTPLETGAKETRKTESKSGELSLSGVTSSLRAEGDQKYISKIISVSPSVQFMQPYLLSRTREHEEILAKLKAMLDKYRLIKQEFPESEYAGHEAKFNLIQPEIVQQVIENPSKQMLDFLFALYDAENDKYTHSHQTQKRQWEVYLSENRDLFDPFHHQKIAILYGMINSVKCTPCIGPEVFGLSYYNDRDPEEGYAADITLGQYVEDLCSNAHTVCNINGCTEILLNHHRQYVHGYGQLSVFMAECPTRSPNKENLIFMWSQCRICNYESPAVKMSNSTWKYSFAKYLELSFWSKSMHLKSEKCAHDVYVHHTRYFGFNNVCLKIQYDKIQLHELLVPSPTIAWKVERDLRLKNDQFQSIRDRLEKFILSVHNRLQSIRIENIATDKTEACVMEIERMRKQIDSDSVRLMKLLENEYMNSKYYEILPMNNAVRAHQECALMWDEEFAEFERAFFPSSTDLRQLATLQFRKLFLDKYDNSNIIQTTEEVEIQARESESVANVTATGTCEKSTNETGDVTGLKGVTNVVTTITPTSDCRVEGVNPKLTPCGSCVKSEELAARMSNLSKQDIKSGVKKGGGELSQVEKVGTSGKSENGGPIRDSVGKCEVKGGGKSIERKDSGDTKAISMDTRAVEVAKTETSYNRDGNGGGISRSTSGLGLAPSLSFRKKNSRVSSLARHFEKLSREFEQQRVEEQRLRAAKASRGRLHASVSSKFLVEVYQDAQDAVKDEGQIEEDTTGQAIEKPKGIGGEPIKTDQQPTVLTQLTTLPLSLSEFKEKEKVKLDGKVDRVTESEGEKERDIGNSSLEYPGDGQIELPKHEKSSIMKMLASFWSERSASGWTGLDYPLLASEHIWDDSTIILREDEPSSVIALALSSSDYLARVEEFRGGVDDGKKEIQCEDEALERNLLFEENTNIRYEFKSRDLRVQCKIFYAESFDALRRKCGIEERFVESLSRCLKWDSKGGRTKSLFMKTLDDRFILKSLSASEANSFFKFAPNYFAFMHKTLFKGLPSIMAKMVGFFHVTIRSLGNSGTESFNWFMLVLENIFYDRELSRRFDLKGSMRNRKIQSTGEEDEVLLDENLVDIIFERPIFVRDHSKKMFQASVWNDTLFLSKQNVMDYSLLAGFDDSRGEITVGIIDCIRTYTWDKKVESWIKDRGKSKPTIMSPKEYRNRFRIAMSSYILEAPTCWSDASQQSSGGST